MNRFDVINKICYCFSFIHSFIAGGYGEEKKWVVELLIKRNIYLV